MQLSLIFTTLVTFAAIAASHSTPKLVRKHTSLAKRQELSSNLVGYLNTRLETRDTPDTSDTPDTPDSSDSPDSDTESDDKSASSDTADNVNNDDTGHKDVGSHHVHKQSSTPPDSKSTDSDSTKKDNDKSAVAHEEVESYVHKRKDFVYRLRNEKHYQ